MKNKLFPVLFAFPLTTGVCAAILRAGTLNRPIEEAPAIAPLMYGLIVVCIIAFVMALIAAFLVKDGLVFSGCVTKKLLFPSMFVGAAIILIYAVLSLLPLRYEFDTTRLVLALFSIYCAVSLLVLAKYGLSERDETGYCIFSAVPSFWACFMIILAFREKVSDPIVSHYAFLMFSYISILFFCYSVAAHILGRNRKAFAVFSCFIGIFFSLTEILSLVLSGSISAFSADAVRELLPLVAFVLLMPCATAEILRIKK